MLGQCSSLAVLNLQHNDIGAEGADRLAGVLAQCSSLAVLKLAGNRIGADGAGRLADVLGQCLSLAVLDLGGNGIGAEGVVVGSAIQYENPHAAAIRALSPGEIRRSFNEFRLERGWSPLSEPRYSPPCTPD